MDISQRGLFTVQELIDYMLDRGESASLENWGICLKEGVFWIAEESENSKLLLPLLEILEFADGEFPEFGRDELIILFGDEGGEFGWALVSPNQESGISREIDKRLLH